MGVATDPMTASDGFGASRICVAAAEVGSQRKSEAARQLFGRRSNDPDEPLVDGEILPVPTP